MGHPSFSNVQAPQSSSAPWWLFGLLVILGLVAVVISWMQRQKEQTAPAGTTVPAPAKPMASRSAPVAEAPEPKIAAEPEPVAEVEESAVEETPAAPVTPDNLTRIEGIGPKISSWFNDAGITTFAQLAEMTPEQITDILQNAGHRIANPATWPEQARLAAAGEWDTLAALQDNLHGGRRLAD